MWLKQLGRGYVWTATKGSKFDIIGVEESEWGTTLEIV